MSEPKTFVELSLQDTIYWANDKHHSSDGIIKIEADPDDNNRVLIELSESMDPISFPDLESVYIDKDSGTKYTTDKKQYNEWITPFIEQKILEKEKKIEAIQLEIQELKDSIPKS